MSAPPAVIAAFLGGMLGLGVVLLVFGTFARRVAVDVDGRPAPAPGLGDRLRAQLRLAGLGGVSPGTVLLVALVAGLVLAALAQGILGLPVLSAVAFVLGAVGPFAYVRRRAAAQLRRQRAGWPDAVDHLVASVRAGQGLADAIGGLADLGPVPTRPAFAAFAADYRNTGDFAVALDRLEARLADPAADRILETLRMAREVGGTEVTEVLRGLAASLREDQALRSELVARQSWIRNAALLGVAAPWGLLLLLATRPETIAAYDTPGGTALLLAGVVVTVVAYRTMVALGRLPEERRWVR